MPETDATARSKFRVVIRGSIQDVWDEITRTDQPIPAFFNNRMDVGRMAAGAKLARSRVRKRNGREGLAADRPRSRLGIPRRGP